MINNLENQKKISESKRKPRRSFIFNLFIFCLIIFSALIFTRPIVIQAIEMISQSYRCINFHEGRLVFAQFVGLKMDQKTTVRGQLWSNGSNILGPNYWIGDPDLDLHAFTATGKHVGINYETGLYERQIPCAYTQGDIHCGEEWIFVPKNTKVYFVVSSKDIEKLLDKNPELKELTDGVEHYEVQAVFNSYSSEDKHYDQYRSDFIFGSIEPGNEQEHKIVDIGDKIRALPAVKYSKPDLQIIPFWNLFPKLIIYIIFSLIIIRFTLGIQNIEPCPKILEKFKKITKYLLILFFILFFIRIVLMPLVIY